jgi:endonuclease/exonuclease/phosphatase (EEP) superfamily protein YafD
MDMSVLVWVVVAPFAAWAVLRLSGAEPDWPWVPMVAYTPYAALAAGAALLLAALSRRRAASVVALAATVALGGAVVPRGFADGGAEPDGGTLRVLAANLMVGSAGTAELMALVTRLRPDVLALQELTPDALERLDAGLRETLPHAVTSPKPGVGGSAVYARYPLKAGALLEFGGFGQAGAVLSHPGGARVEVVSVHPCAPRYRGRQPCWRAGLQALPRADAPWPDAGDRVRGSYRVLAGDFNATLDHLGVRELLDSGYRDAADVTGHGFSATWPQTGWLPGVAIDHVLADARMGVREFGVHPLAGSDHRPVFAVLTLP